MGVKGFWETVSPIHPGRTLPLWELNAEHVEETGRPMRIAIDIPIAIYKYMSATKKVYKENHGGMNHPTRNLFSFILRILEAGDQPVFVYDGRERAPLKRGARTNAVAPRRGGRGGSSGRTTDDERREQNLHYIIELSQEMLRWLGLPCIVASGEAEAECARLEMAAVVDAVITGDGDAFLFGARTVLKYMFADDESKGTSRVRVFKMGGLENANPPLLQSVFFSLALFAGGDYDDKGLRHCGPDLALKIGASEHGAALWTLS
ncbi:hypothetical protein PG994_008664 [Apiospora phragmitis]|uniref:XPG-I domain-containing protein n=1 Tax=Apiospora phragmitis TaxID=2905665 RepID=A0ABR1UH32_9PEZI